MLRLALLLSYLFIILITGCAGPASIGVSQHKWQQMSDSDKQHLKDKYSKVRNWRRSQSGVSSSKSKLALTIVGGTALMPPDFARYHFKQLHINIRSGSCLRVKVSAQDYKRSTRLSLCYKNSILSLDPSNYEWEKRAGTLLLTKNPMWRSGLVYDGNSIDSHGYVAFHDISIHIKQLPG